MLPDPPTATPRVVGGDEDAQFKARVYGTVLVDVETRRPMALLPDREADTLAAGLAERPGIEIVRAGGAVTVRAGACLTGVGVKGAGGRPGPRSSRGARP
ncbi:uncharacterized protein GlcG (DUF336 family) [Streptomyces stelliscabiei]|uniref:Uncharacterized protein GlcG (DUF336 family) n=1 Tax=Streptomyces stelliscabiei TaxID=146820 RepID=A0A8I0TW92_9ACTN|nr:uncharacterized protein GlcG (DUF336 family) [Streptomyces stelliscabiei]